MRIVRALGLALGLLCVLAAGIWLGGHPAKLPPPLRDAFVGDSAGLTAEATELIEGNYFRPVSSEQLGDASLRGMVRDLRRRNRDRFSEYISPADFDHFKEAIRGRFSGVGMSVSAVPAGLRVRQVFEDSPAQRGGIEVGDTVIAAAGRSLAGLSAERASAIVKGPEGTEVALTVRKPGGKVRRLRLERAEIAVPVVEGRIERGADGEKVAYVRFAAFTEGSHGALRETVERLRKRGAEGLVLDLRANGGGLFEEAVRSASVFLPEGNLVVTTRSRSEGRAAHRALGGNLPAQPTVVLIDGGTASAAEILAAALGDDLGAVTVGETSYGKGVFQRELDLSNGGALKLTVGEYFTPEGRNLAGKGIEPDVRVADRHRTAADEALERALEELP